MPVRKTMNNCGVYIYQIVIGLNEKKNTKTNGHLSKNLLMKCFLANIMNGKNNHNNNKRNNNKLFIGRNKSFSLSHHGQHCQHHHLPQLPQRSCCEDICIRNSTSPYTHAHCNNSQFCSCLAKLDGIHSVVLHGITKLLSLFANL